jgi:chromosome segregation ATPase
MSTKTIDVNIPASAFEELAEAVTNHLDLDSAIDNSELAGRVSEVEESVENMRSDIDDLATQNALDELESRVQDLEDKKINSDGEPIVHRIEKLEEACSPFVAVSDRLDRVEDSIHARLDGLNDRIRELENRVNKFDTVFAEMAQAIKLTLS